MTMDEIDVLARFGDDVPPMSAQTRARVTAELQSAADADHEPMPLSVATVGETAELAQLPRRRRALRLGAVAAGITVAAGAVIALQVGGSAPAYATVTTTNGVVTVHIKEFLEPKKVEARMAAAGLPAVVDYLPLGQMCRQPRGTAQPLVDDSAKGTLSVSSGDSAGAEFQVEMANLKPGQTLVLEASFAADNPEVAGSFAVSLVSGPVSPCNPVPAPVSALTGPVTVGSGVPGTSGTSRSTDQATAGGTSTNPS
jgi:hypothetical protein